MGILLTIDVNSNIPIFRQIMAQIIDRIEKNDIKPGIRLPSTRSMADKLSVNRSTVYKAYQELWSLGYLESRPGSYTTVRNRKKVVIKPTSLKRAHMNWSDKVTSGTKKVHLSYVLDMAISQKTAPPDMINFIPLSPDNRLLPSEVFRKCVSHVLTSAGPDLLQYGNPLGFEPLRKFIAERMREHSVSISSDEIIITAGAQNAIGLILGMLTTPGNSVVVEAPTYSRIIDLLRLRGVKIIEIPMAPHGMDLKALESVLIREKPSMIYTIPNFHNPTGITTDQCHREILLNICERHEIPLIEDGFEEEMKYFGKTVLPIKSMDHNGIVIYIGTFSKVLSPGLRIGWIAADKKCIEYLASIQRATTISGNLLSQAALYFFCKTGHYELHIKRIHRIYRKRMQKAIQAFQRYFNPELIEYIQPVGGYTIWLTIKNLSVSEINIFEYLIEHGVAVLPGSIHFHTPSDKVFFRISIAHVDEKEIEEGVKRLAQSLTNLYINEQSKIITNQPAALAAKGRVYEN